MDNLETKPVRKTTATLASFAVAQFQQTLNELVTTVREEGEVDESWQLDVQNMRWVREKKDTTAEQLTDGLERQLKLEV